MKTTASSWSLDLRTEAEIRVGILPMDFDSKDNLEFTESNYDSKFFYSCGFIILIQMRNSSYVANFTQNQNQHSVTPQLDAHYFSLT